MHTQNAAQRRIKVRQVLCIVGLLELKPSKCQGNHKK
jgi:hypothetical protein